MGLGEHDRDGSCLFTTPRLDVEPCDPSAARELHRMALDPRIREPFHLGHAPRLPARHAMEQRRQAPGDWRRPPGLNLAARDRQTGSLIGFLQVSDKRLGYFIDPRVWILGYASEMVAGFCDYLLERLRIDQLEAIVGRENVGSRRVLEKCGFTFTAVANCRHGDSSAIVTALIYRRSFS
jgi:RimJ/RimL family protein N-acetyltransferase